VNRRHLAWFAINGLLIAAGAYVSGYRAGRAEIEDVPAPEPIPPTPAPAPDDGPAA
jgi:hypothetical protein